MEEDKKKQFEEWNADLRARGQREMKWDRLYEDDKKGKNDSKESRA